jgi:DNA invertase Pin-like site-specific DNA recombinase
MYQDEDEPQIDITKLRYVLYARKSTDDPKRQIRSINDQIDECKLLAERSGMRIVKVLKEEKSAKKPSNRKVFNEMMKGIESGKYDAILAWNPDRLARNMIEGSHILNLVDDGTIQDLKFVTHFFTNDASGKMLLGISFVMADYYSRNLSQNVTRGVRIGLKEGKSAGTPMHGYIRGEDGIYRPDNENGSKNLDLICEAWRMRKDGKSLESIAKYMNDNGYARIYKEGAEKAGKKVLMSDKILSDRVFPNPFYYGVLIQKGKAVDLRELEGYDFEPATDEETYNYVQRLTGRRSTLETKRKVFKPLVEMVYCAYCNSKMYPQVPSSRKILSYRCDNQYCQRKVKELKLSQSVRAITIFNFMYEMLDGLDVNREDYEKLRKRLEARNKAKLQETRIKVHSLQGAVKSMDRDVNERSLQILSLNKTSPVYKNNERYIEEQTVKMQELQGEIEKLQEQITDPNEDVMSFDEFLNIVNSAGKLLRAADVGLKDRIARLIYLNVRVDSENVVDYQMREPFKTYFKTHKILNGRNTDTANEPVLDTLYNLLLHYKLLLSKLTDLNQLVADLIKPERAVETQFLL